MTQVKNPRVHAEILPSLPAVVAPTNKILAIGSVTAKGTPEAIAPVLPFEVRATVRNYLAGKLDLESRASERPSDKLNELTVTAPAVAIRDGWLTAQDYAATLLSRSREKTDLRAFISLDVNAVLQAAAKADQHRKSGKPMGLLHGVPTLDDQGVEDGIS